MEKISFRQTESALFNLDSMRTKLLNEQYEQAERDTLPLTYYNIRSQL